MDRPLARVRPGGRVRESRPAGVAHGRSAGPAAPVPSERATVPVVDEGADVRSSARTAVAGADGCRDCWRQGLGACGSGRAGEVDAPTLRVPKRRTTLPQEALGFVRHSASRSGPVTRHGVRVGWLIRAVRSR